MATENHYPEGQIWDADGIKIPIGGMSFDGAKYKRISKSTRMTSSEHYATSKKQASPFTDA